MHKGADVAAVSVHVMAHATWRVEEEVRTSGGAMRRRWRAGECTGESPRDRLEDTTVRMV